MLFFGGVSIPDFFFLQPKEFWCNSSQDALHVFDDANPAKWITGKKNFIAQKAIG